MREPAETRGAIPLYQVLVEELNHQYPDFPLSIDEIEAQRPAYEAEYDAEHQHGKDQPSDALATPEARDERRKAIDYRLVREFYTLYHAKRRQRPPGERLDRAALCFSGGGIRSATFGLGVLQGLAHLGLLGKFDYLSTVSGGGYLGSWLSAWVHREGGVENVQDQLRNPPRFPLSPEPQPVSHLRSYSRYMSPKLGLLSADTWTLVAIFFRNLFLNWLVLLPLLSAFLLIPRVSVFLVRKQELWPYGPAVFWLGLLAGIASIAYIGINRPSLADKPGLLHFPEKLRSQEWFLVLCLLPLIFMAISAALYWAWNPIPPDRLTFEVLGFRLRPLAAFVLYGIVLHGGAYLVARLFVRLPWREILGVFVTGGFGGYAAWLAATRLFPEFATWKDVELYVCVAAPLLLFLFLASATLFTGLSSKYTDDADREWLARAAAWILIAIVLRTALGLIVIYGPVVWHALGVKTMGAVGGISGLLTLLLGQSSKTGASESKKGEPVPASAKAVSFALSLAAPLFALTIVVALALGTTLLVHVLSPYLAPGFEWPLDFTPDDTFSHLVTVYATPGRVTLEILLLFLAVGGIMGFYVDINRFSLHAAYRDRLIRAYLGASRNHDERHPNPFTGFDEADNLQLKDLHRDVGGKDGAQRPFHLINAALNLVGGKNLAWQDRKAESFTFSTLHSGSYCTGYRRSERYGLHSDRKTAVSLGTAFAISGAAASPNMGYHSSPVVTFLLALFNVRLGWWLGNPGPQGEKTYARSGPLFAPRPLIEEAFGLTDDQHPYVYLSDGGHFENLGLYEMVLRRCRYIVVSDGGGDPDFEFEDLGNALGKIRIDLGVPIDFQRLPMHKVVDLPGKSYDLTTGKPDFPYAAFARIRYSCVDAPEAPDEHKDEIDGWLVYFKPALNGTEPADVFHYAKLHPSFPHESTGNQLYSEAEFESYRALGRHVLDAVARDLPEPTLEEFFRAVEAYAAG